MPPPEVALSCSGVPVQSVSGPPGVIFGTMQERFLTIETFDEGTGTPEKSSTLVNTISGLPSPSMSAFLRFRLMYVAFTFTTGANADVPGVVVLFFKTETDLAIELTAISSLPSPSKSLKSTPTGSVSVMKKTGSRKEKSDAELFRYREISLPVSRASVRSGFPSASRSATRMLLTALLTWITLTSLKLKDPWLRAMNSLFSLSVWYWLVTISGYPSPFISATARASVDEAWGMVMINGVPNE